MMMIENKKVKYMFRDANDNYTFVKLSAEQIKLIEWLKEMGFLDYDVQIVDIGDMEFEDI